MADERGSSSHELQKVKKKRLQGACDACRKRKIKCDSALRPGNICTYCEDNDIQCTHEAPRPPKKKDLQDAYIRGLEERLSKMEHILRAFHPDTDVETLLDLPPSEVLKSEPSKSASKKFLELKYPAPQLSSALLPDGSSPDSIKQEPVVDPVEEQQDLSHVDLVEHMNKLFIEDNKRFFGQASAYMFAQYAMHAKMEASGTHTEYPLDSKMLRRPLYWGMRPWEIAHAKSEEHIRFDFPEPDLLASLVSLYFEKSNIILPILHRPTFLRSLDSGLHLTDTAFAMTVLLVCSIGSGFTSDSRVLLDGDISDLSSGWKYFIQVPVFRKSLFVRSTIYDLQCYTLSVVYLLGTSTAHVVWPMLGLGVRFIQEKGIHRRKGQQERTVKDESEKLAFWCLICLDRWMSAFLGRPCAMQDEEFDLEYPVECDEEYWETSDPEKAFQQPPGKPCKMTAFIWLIKLAEMLGFAHRTLYATKKSKILIGVIGNEWESRVVSELDSSMNKWQDNLPHFLRWNPDNPDDTFFCQSVALYTSFYHLQIQVHRPFLMKRSALSRTSLAMCTSAARSTAHVLEAAMSRRVALFASSHMSGFAASLVLLLTSQWANQQSDPSFDSKTTMELVRNLFLALKDGERRWHMAGRFADLMQMLCSLGDHPASPQPKRRPVPNITDPAVSQSQQNYHGTLWEQPSFAGGPLQRQIAAAKLELPPHMQEYDVPTGLWDINNFPTPSMNSHVQQSFVTSQVDNALNLLPNTDFTLPLETNFHLPASSQEAYPCHLLDPLVQGYVSGEDPAALDVSNELFAMWENAPISFSSYDWDIFLSNAMQPQSDP